MLRSPSPSEARAEIRRACRHHEIVEVLGVGRIGVGVMAAEIGQRRAVDDRACARLELALEDRVSVGAGYRVQGVEAHAKPGGEQGADGVEIEQGLHQRQILGDRVDHLDLHALDLDRPKAVDVDVRRVGNLVGRDRLALGEDRLGDVLRRRAAGADIVFDPEIPMRPAGIVARRQDDAAEGVKRPDQRRDRRGRENSALADDDAAEAVGGGDLDHDLDRLAVEEPPVAAEHQRLALEALERVENRLDEVFEIARLLKHRNLLAQSRCSRPLVGERLGGDGSDHGRRPPAAFGRAQPL